jgi:TRAP-type mannitol/chloroaromatic compound transport system permease small subunit
MAKVLKIIDKTNETVGKIVSYFIWAPLLVLVFETISRYFFNSPTDWAHHFSVTSTIIVFLLPGGYTLLKKGHVWVDVFTERLSVRARAIVDMCTSPVFFITIFAFFWHGLIYGADSVNVLETSGSPLYWPLWPYKILLPIAGVLLLAQGAAQFCRNLMTAIAGRKYEC